MNDVLMEITKRAKPYEESDMIITIFGKYYNDVNFGTIPVILYGAGSAGKELFHLLKLYGVNPVCFCDSSPLRAGEIFCGLPIVSPSELKEHHKNSLIFITIGAHREQIKQQLLDAGFDENKLLSIADQEALCYYTHLYQWRWSLDDLETRQNELFTVYNVLSDKKSRDIFTSRIALFVNGADYRSFCNFIANYADGQIDHGTAFQECLKSPDDHGEAYLQFNNDLIRLSNNETLIDGGAYTGDSTIEFILACKKQNASYREIFCFEPDPAIFAKLKENTAPYQNITLKPFGLWSHTTNLKFADSTQLRPGSTQIVTDNDSASTIEIATTSIDECFSDADITIIKMDIEGAEIEALRGAAKTIKRCKPKLIISAYHKRNDLFEIPLLIHQLVPEYKLYFRHFSRNFGETTLFAIP